MISTENFIFDQIEFKRVISKEISNKPKRSQIVGLTSVLVTCIACGTPWTAAAYGHGKFAGSVGGAMDFKCPECGKVETVMFNVFRESQG